MRISPGTRIGRYEVVAHIGTGGMGEVYRARDANLEKDVAVKVIAEAFAADAMALPRFDRERRVGAVLEHPHICRLLDAGRDGAVDYLVMELLNGEPLSARLARGPLPIHEALGYAIEIADALRYAHAHEVLHRDLKPANVFLSASGAKVLDFGLAKLRTALAQGGRAMGDTRPIEVTKHNEVLGSAPYMAPERLEGHEADTRTDIFAFGVLVYEMVTGRPAFARASTADTLAALLTADLPPMQMPASLAPDLEWIVRKAVARNPADRWQSMADVHALLKRLAGTGLSQPVATARRSWWIPALTSLLLLSALGALGFVWGGRGPARSGEPIALSVVPPMGHTFSPTEGSVTSAQLALSPDGRAVVFVGTGSNGSRQLWLRRLSSLAPVPLAGTEGATFPFWSPNGASVGFFARQALRIIDLAGGPARRLAPVANGRGGSWSENDDIIYAPETDGVVMRVSAGGGAASAVTSLDTVSDGVGHRWPHFLPGGRRFLFFARNAQKESEEGIYLASLDGGPARMVLNAHSGAAFLPPNRILFVADGTLVSREFDPESGGVTGPQVPLAEHVATSSNFYSAFSAAGNGTIAYGPVAMRSDLVWKTREGRIDGTVGALGQYVDFGLSPDGTKVAVAEVDGENAFTDIYVINLSRGGQKSKITFSRVTDATPVWAPDGQRIVFRSNRRAAHDLYLIDPERPGSEVDFQFSPAGKYPTSWSRDGEIVYHLRRPESGFDVLVAEARPGSAAHALLDTSSNEVQGQLSPDGRWLAYTSDESNTPEVYLRAKAGGPRKPVSVKGGIDPKWARTSGELFYIDTTSRRLTSVSVSFRDTDVVLGAARELFEVRDVSFFPPYLSTYEVSPDGTRFLVRDPKEDVRTTPLAVLLNWTTPPQR
jgi:eukaryotic-like serine/threonine-protein kinase